MKRISHIAIGMLLLLQSCLKEDMPNCESDLLLRFRYTLNGQYENLFGAEVNRITVYIFDSNGKYVDSFSEQGDKLTNDYLMRIPLPEGKYSAVVWGGDMATYSVGELDSQTSAINQILRKGVTDIHDFRTELKNRSGEGGYLFATDTPNDLYAGLATDVTSAISNKNITDIELTKDTKKIKVKITGTSTIPQPLEVYITAVNGRYGFDNTIDTDHGTFKYTPVNFSVQPDQLVVDLKMMRLMSGQSPMLVVRNSVTSEILYNANMIDYILSTPQYASQEDIDREDEFVFEITFIGNVVIAVSVNGWQINEVNPDM